MHVFNSSVLSGPEMLVLPALKNMSIITEIWSLEESRTLKGRGAVARFCRQLKIAVRSFPIQRRLDWMAIFYMAKRMRKLNTKPLIFHSHDAKASVYVWLARLVSGQFSICLIATHHGAMIRPNVMSRVYEIIFVFISAYFFRFLLCVSESEFQILRRRGVSANVLRLHRNGISRPPLAWQERRAAHIDQEIRFVMVARLSREKNHCRAIDVLKCLSRYSEKRWSLDLIGDGDERERILSHVRESKLSHCVFFKGFIPDAWKEMDHYHCLLSFSLGEGLPVSLLEAAWRQTPVFASAVGGVPEVCCEGGGLLFSLRQTDDEIARALAEYMNSPERLKKSSELLHRNVQKHFSESSWQQQLMHHYASALGIPL